MLRTLTIVVVLAVSGCNQQKLFTNDGSSATIPGGAIEAYSKSKGLSPQEARQAMIADNLTSRGASLPKKALQPK
jgi:hypothetical protein